MKDTVLPVPENHPDALRKMRDTVYGEAISDTSWQHILPNWKKDAAWLDGQYKIEIAKHAAMAHGPRLKT